MISKIYRADSSQIANIKSVAYEEATNAGVDLRPGCVASAFINVTVYGAKSSAPTPGEELTYYQVDADGNDVYIGTFYAEPSVQTKNSYSFIAYDAVSKLNVDFSAQLANIQENFPMTLADLVDEACTVAGVTNATPTFPMYDMVVNQFYVSNLTCREILSYAAELACCFVRCDENGDIEFAWYAAKANYRIYPTGGVSGSETRIAYKQDGLEYATYNAQLPGCVAVRPSGTDGVAYIYPTVVTAVYATDPLLNGVVTLHNITAVETSSGEITLSGDITVTESDGNVDIQSDAALPTDPLVISNNILLTGADEATYNAVAQNVYTRMSGIPLYHPGKANLFPMENPFRAGDIVAVTDSQSVSFYMPIMHLSVSDAAAVVEATGNEVMDGNGSDEHALTQLAADIVRINKLKVDWAEIDEAIINTVEANELKSNDYSPANNGIYAESGMGIDLANKTIKATDFAVTADGKLYADAAEIAGASFFTSHFYSTVVWNAGIVQDGYTKFGAIPYRTLASISIIGMTAPKVLAKFDYYNGSTKVYSSDASVVSVASFRIPLYSGTADSVVVWLKLNGETATITTVSVGSTSYGATFPYRPTFSTGISCDGVTINSTFLNSLVKATSVTVPANDSATISLSSGTRGIILFSSVGDYARGLYFFSCASDGTVKVTNGVVGSSLTFTEGLESITIASTSSYTTYGILIAF